MKHRPLLWILPGAAVVIACGLLVFFSASRRSTIELAARLLRPLERLDPHGQNLVARLEYANDVDGNRHSWEQIAKIYEPKLQRPSDDQVVFVFNRRQIPIWTKPSNPRMIVVHYDLKTSATIVKAEEVW